MAIPVAFWATNGSSLKNIHANPKVVVDAMIRQVMVLTICRLWLTSLMVLLLIGLQSYDGILKNKLFYF